MEMGTKGYQNWGLNEDMEALLNGIDLSPEKRVIMTDGNNQYIYDDGQIYSTSTKSYTEGKLLSKEEFRQKSEEIMINHMFNNKNDIVIE